MAGRARVWNRYVGPMILIAIVLLAPTPSTAAAQSEDCPSFTAPSTAPDAIVALSTNSNPLAIAAWDVFGNGSTSIRAVTLTRTRQSS